MFNMVALRGTVSLQMKAIITIDASLYKRQTFLFPGGTENESPWNVFTKYQDMLPCWHLIGRKGYLLLPGTLRKKYIYIYRLIMKLNLVPQRSLETKKICTHVCCMLSEKPEGVTSRMSPLNILSMLMWSS